MRLGLFHLFAESHGAEADRGDLQFTATERNELHVSGTEKKTMGAGTTGAARTQQNNGFPATPL
jgi:ribosomal protein L4